MVQNDNSKFRMKLRPSTAPSSAATTTTTTLANYKRHSTTPKSLKSPSTTTVVLITQSTVVSTASNLLSWNTLQSVQPTSLNHPGRARKWTAVTDYGSQICDDPGVETYEFHIGQIIQDQSNWPTLNQ